MSKGEKVLTIFFGGLIFVSLATTLVGKNKNTPAVINSTGSAISSTLKAAQGG
jgi:hypothetical protein